MYHSISIGDYNTYSDFYLVPESMPAFAPPAPKTTYQDIPGADGSIDLSTALTGDVVYSNRTGSINFIVEPGHESWAVTYSRLMNAIHGKRLKIILEDDTDWYYMGRFYVSTFTNGKAYPSGQLSYTLEPYKYSIVDTDSATLWDPFDFDEDTAREWYDLDINNHYSMSFTWARGSAVPEFKFKPSGTYVLLKITITNSSGSYTGSYSVTAGKINSITDPNICFKQGSNTLEISGIGTMDIHATERSL